MPLGHSLRMEPLAEAAGREDFAAASRENNEDPMGGGNHASMKSGEPEDVGSRVELAIAVAAQETVALAGSVASRPSGENLRHILLA